jgi:hypothetical protein
VKTFSVKPLISLMRALENCPNPRSRAKPLSGGLAVTPHTLPHLVGDPKRILRLTYFLAGGFAKQGEGSLVIRRRSPPLPEHHSERVLRCRQPLVGGCEK